MSYYIIIRGPLGCGKTTLAKQLSKTLSAQYFSIDQILDKHKLTTDREEGYISQRSFLKANEVIIPKVKQWLDKDKPVIIDGNFYWESQLEDLTNKLKYPHYVFTLKAPLKVCLERDSQREIPHGRDAAKVIYKKVIEWDYGTIIDISKSLDETLKEILKHLQKKIKSQ